MNARTSARPASITSPMHPLVLLGERLGGVEQHDRDLGGLDRARRCAGWRSTPCRWPGRTRRRSPAVSTNRQISPSSSTRLSTGSIVVPATESTTERSSPVSRLSRLDLPTFGRPISATRRGPPPPRLGGRGRQGGEHGVEQVAAAPPVQAADRIRLPKPERPQLGRVGLGALVVDLGDREHDRPVGAAQGAGHHQVGVGGAGAAVDDEQHEIGGGHRPFGLRGHHGLQPARVRFPAAGVDER